MRLRMAAVCVLGTFAVLAVAANGMTATTCTNWASFVHADQTTLRRLNVKLTWVGPRDREYPCVVIRATGATVEIRPFYSCRHDGLDYGSDAFMRTSVQVGHAVLGRMVDTLGAVPAIEAGAIDVGADLSVSVIDPATGAKRVAEAVVNGTVAHEIFARLLAVCARSDSAQRTIGRLMCAVGDAPDAPGVDISSSVTVALGDVRYRKTDRMFVSTISVKNTSSSVITGPVILGVTFLEDVRMTNGDGVLPCYVDPAEADYLRLDLPGGLAPGRSVSRELILRNDEGSPVKLSRWALRSKTGY